MERIARRERGRSPREAARPTNLTFLASTDYSHTIFKYLNKTFMNKLHFVFGLLFFSLSIGWISGQDKPKFAFELESVKEVDSMSSATKLYLDIVVKNTGDFIPYPAMRVAINDTIVAEPELVSYGVVPNGTQQFRVIVPRLKKDEKQYRLIVESYEVTITDKVEFAYKPKPYKAPKAKKVKVKKVKAKKAELKKAEVKKEISAPVEINSTPPSPPSN
jgi:hypothetical protein